MDPDIGQDAYIDPEVRAIVNSLVTALGGPSASEEGVYVLGDDALAVLKDIKKWLRLYDDKLGRLDVARLLAEANLVQSDLLEIIALWKEDASESSFKAKISLFCFDLLNQLTWPVEKTEASDHTLPQVYQLPYIKLAQASYKRAILHHETSKVLRAAIRVALPSMAQPQRERTPRDENIIKVVMYMFRNVLMISKPENIVLSEGENEISRSATIDAFHTQDVLDLLLTMCSSMTDEFSNHDIEILEILFHLLKGIDVESLFLEREEMISSNTMKFKNLINKEKGMLSTYARYQPSRHNRFGTMLWVKGSNEQLWTVSGQKALQSMEVSVAEMDKSKKWKKPRTGRKQTPTDELTEFDTTVPLTGSARRRLRGFVEKFLDSSFNPLFTNVRRSIEREATNVQQISGRQYFYLTSWFLRAECARRMKATPHGSSAPAAPASDIGSFALVASVLNQETFVLLGRHMQTAQDEKNWQDLNAAMKCFTQILLTVQEMSESALDEDQDIAENILSRIFYEQSTHERVIGLLRTFKGQGFGYLNSCTELAHVFVRLLENYSKQNVDMQIQSRRRSRKKKTQTAKAGNGEHHVEAEDERALRAEDQAEALKTSSERKFDFAKFVAKVVNQSSVDTFIAFLRYYEDLTADQLKRVHRFLYRVAFKMDLTVYLFRVDYIALFHKLVKGPEGLSNDNSGMKEWEELVRQVFKRLLKKLEDRPQLAVEMLFSKIPATAFFLENGYDREIPKKIPRPPAELEVKPGMDKQQQFGVVISALINQTKLDEISFVKETLANEIAQRKAWEDAETARALQQDPEAEPNAEAPIPTRESGQVVLGPEGPGKAMARDKYFRLLLTLLGWEVTTSDMSSACTIPASLTTQELEEHLQWIKGFEYEPPTYDDNKSPEDFLRRKPTAAELERRAQAAAAKEAAQRSDSEGDLDNDILFPAGGPTIRRSSRSPERNKPRKKRNRHSPDGFLDDSVLEERRAARRTLQDERQRKIKSALYVRDSDDESDEEADREFFQKEEDRRRKTGASIIAAAKKAANTGSADNESGRGKRKRSSLDDDASSEEATSDSDGGSLSGSSVHEDSLNAVPRKRLRKSVTSGHLSSTGNTGMGMDAGNVSDADTVLSSDAAELPRLHRGLRSSSHESEADTETDTPPSSQRPFSDNIEDSTQQTARVRRRRVGVLLDSDDEDAEGSDDGNGSDKENAGAGPMSAPPEKANQAPARRNIRAGFIVESDSE